jgi:hypothetical protein
MTLAPPELDILSRVLQPAAGDLSASAARAFLKLQFDADDRTRMRDLLAKNQDDALTEKERQEIRGFELVGHLLDLIHSKARRSLKKSSTKR